ncbi:MAG TPA: outer membrane beta-barrel protein, partial [Flavobacteriaceae bacterium]|nr:outer membrane beta-barrel protein [Flavobacteriaceae bacterium]
PNFSNLIFRSLSGDGFSENENNYSLKPFTSYQLGISYPLLPNTIASLYWSTTKNNIINYPYFSQTGVFEGNRKLNLFDSQSQGLSLSYSKTFWQRLFLSINTNIMRNSWENKGEYEFSTNFINMLGNVNLYYMSKTNWSFNLDYTYSSKQKLSENIELNNSNLLNFSISKKLDSSWSIFLSVNDFLNSYKLDIYANNSVLYESVIKQDQRYVTFGITYGFNKGFKQKKREENLMDDLNKRIRIEEDL